MNANENLRCDNKRCIRDLVKAIDQNQKEALMQNELTGCDAPLIGRINDTRPVSFILSGGNPFTARLGSMTDERTDIFRIEQLQGNCVTLRLLRRTDTITCTDLTCTLDLCCVCAIQCFDPINCLLV